MKQVFNELGSYYPFFSQFGISVEQQVKLVDTQSHFAFQEIFLVGGLDQSDFLPTAAVLFGYKSHPGL